MGDDDRLDLAEAVADAYPAAPTESETATRQVSIAGPTHITSLRVRVGADTITVTRKAQHFTHEVLADIRDAARRCGVALKVQE